VKSELYHPAKNRRCIEEERWSELDVSHELYNAGHLCEAAVAHYLATGKISLTAVGQNTTQGSANVA
jgi:DUF1680 family protein